MYFRIQLEKLINDQSLQLQRTWHCFNLFRLAFNHVLQHFKNMEDSMHFKPNFQYSNRHLYQILSQNAETYLKI